MPSPFGKGVKRDDSTSVAGPASYDPGSRPTVTLSELVNVDSTDDVTAAVANTASGGPGYVAEVSSMNGNVASVQVYDVASNSNAAGGGEVESGTDLSNATVKVQGRGY